MTGARSPRRLGSRFDREKPGHNRHRHRSSTIPTGQRRRETQAKEKDHVPR